MTQEEKQLLLKDLCARLPYKPKVHVEHDVFYDEREPYDTVLDGVDTFANLLRNGIDLKPYLRSMSSITEEEITQLCETVHCNLAYSKEDIQNTLRLLDDITLINNGKAIDWLNAHHFDYRGLIEKGLALEAPEGMYKN